MSDIGKYIKLLENFMSREIMIEHDHGSAEGYVTDTNSEQFINWFNNRHKIYDQTMIDKFKDKYKSVAFLNNMNVDEDSRGNGYGSEILEDFISDASMHYPDAIILIADTEESQNDGFDLVKFYEGYDFEIVKRYSFGILMIMEML